MYMLIGLLLWVPFFLFGFSVSYKIHNGFKDQYSRAAKFDAGSFVGWTLFTVLLTFLASMVWPVSLVAGFFLGLAKYVLLPYFSKRAV